MLVFRENRVSTPAQLLIQTLVNKLQSTGDDRDALLDALLSAGELECALADADAASGARMATITDALAAAVVRGCAVNSAQLLQLLSSAPDVPKYVKVSPPEGFAYYALHPLKYADLAARIPFETARAAVIGIRSIGTTLSAVVVAGLKQRGTQTERMTVRPSGHPFHRVTHFSEEQVAWVERNRGALFLIVDEGPGLSGSSFISVGEALVRTGVARERIRLFCSHHPNPDTLRAQNGAERWSNFQACAVDHESYLPAEHSLGLSGGAWRQQVYRSGREWPSGWPQMERVKFLSADGRRLFKFEGYGKFGATVCDRNRAIARAGFGPEPSDFSAGFATYSWIEGERGVPERVSESLLTRLADYCAFRAGEFRGSASGEGVLAEMLRCNVQEEFGAEVNESLLEPALATIVDGRMHPHEWVHSQKGIWLKMDGGSHGDDHFYPGPTDIAWDVAGAIVEWELDRDATEYFLRRHHGRSGDDLTPRLPAYVLAYAAFRMGYCKMAAESVSDGSEVERLTRDYQRYRSRVEGMLPESSLRLQVSSSKR